MKAVRYEAPGDLSVTAAPMPPLGPLDVRMINQTGVCGTDVHLHHGYRLPLDDDGKALETLTDKRPQCAQVVVVVRGT